MQTQASFSMSQFFKSRPGWVLFVLLAIAAFYLITEHTAHVLGLLPYTLLLLCPLLHLFMHGGQSGHEGHSGHDQHNTHNTNMSVRTQNTEGCNNG